MRYLLSCFTLVILISPAFSQAYWVLPNKNALVMGSCNVEHRCVIDSALMTVSYACVFHKEDSSHCEIARLQVGTHYNRFFGLNRWCADSVYTATYRKLDTSSVVNAKIQNNKCLTFEIIYNKQDDELYNIHRLAFEHDMVIQYNEKNRKLIWKTSDQTRTIDGYLCYMAETQFGGRVWRAWFALEIPLDAGPWKLSGLPGLILEAYDELNDYQFLFKGITQMREPIFRYKYNVRLISKKKWLQYEKALYQAPYVTLQATINTVFYTYDSKAEKIISLDNNWTIPYNPIELE